MDSHVCTYVGQDEEFAPEHLPFYKLDNKELSDWAKNAVKGASGTRLYILVDIHADVTPGMQRHYWVMVCAKPTRFKEEEIRDGDLWARAFDVTRAYEKGFKGVLPEGTKVDGLSDSSDFLGMFNKGRLYQAGDEAARTGRLELLEGLAIDLCKRKARSMGL